MRTPVIELKLRRYYGLRPPNPRYESDLVVPGQPDVFGIAKLVSDCRLPRDSWKFAPPLGCLDREYEDPEDPYYDTCYLSWHLERGIGLVDVDNFGLLGENEMRAERRAEAALLRKLPCNSDSIHDESTKNAWSELLGAYGEAWKEYLFSGHRPADKMKAHGCETIEIGNVPTSSLPREMQTFPPPSLAVARHMGWSHTESRSLDRVIRVICKTKMFSLSDALKLGTNQTRPNVMWHLPPPPPAPGVSDIGPTGRLEWLRPELRY